MRLGSFVKSPVERKRYTIDYSDWLDTGETVGLYDGTADGNGTATTVNLPSSENNENWKVEDGADITIDATQ